MTVDIVLLGGTEPTRNEVVNSDTAATTVQLSQPNLKYLSTTGPIGIAYYIFKFFINVFYR